MDPHTRVSLAELIAAVGPPGDATPHVAVGLPTSQSDGGSSGSRDADALPTNPGTIGHDKLLCGRPCVHFKHGRCSNGDACQFCHAPHGRPHQLDKRRREMLRTLPLRDVQALMFPLVEHKARNADDSAATTRALEHLAYVCGVVIGAAPPPPDRRLVAGLRAMAASHLLATFVSLMRAHGAEDARAAGEYLVAQLASSLRDA